MISFPESRWWKKITVFCLLFCALLKQFPHVQVPGYWARMWYLTSLSCTILKDSVISRFWTIEQDYDILSTKRFRHFQILDTWERLWYSVSLFCVLLKDSPSSDWARIWYCTVSHCKVSQCYLTVFIILMISVFTEHVQEFLLLFYSPHR